MIGRKFLIDNPEIEERLDNLQTMIIGINHQVLDLVMHRSVYHREIAEIIRDSYPELSGHEFRLRHSAGIGMELEVTAKLFDTQ